MTRPLLCTKCDTPAEIVQDGTAWDDWGPAVVDDDGIVRPVARTAEFHKGELTRTRAVCPNTRCRHQWTLRRRFEPKPVS